MADALIILAALIWIAAGCYVVCAIRHFIKGCDKVIRDMAADEERVRKELWQ